MAPARIKDVDSLTRSRRHPVRPRDHALPVGTVTNARNFDANFASKQLGVGRNTRKVKKTALKKNLKNETVQNYVKIFEQIP